MSRQPDADGLLLTVHARALAELSRRPTASARELADELGVTQRHAQRVVADLVAAGYVDRERVGRRNRYRVRRDLALHRAGLAAATLGELLDLIAKGLG